MGQIAGALRSLCGPWDARVLLLVLGTWTSHVVELWPVGIRELADELHHPLPQSDNEGAADTHERDPQAPMLPSSTIAVVITANEPKKPRKADLKEGT